MQNEKENAEWAETLRKQKEEADAILAEKKAGEGRKADKVPFSQFSTVT